MKISKKISVITLAALFSLLFAMTVFAAPAKVTEIKQTKATDSSVQFEWSPSEPDARYYVQYSFDNVSWSLEASTGKTTSQYYGSLKAGKTYYVRVRARVNNQYSDYTTAQVATAPDKVTNLKQISATTSSATFSWSASEGATSYEVVRYVNSTEYIIGTTTSTTYTVNDFKNKLENNTSIGVRPIRSIAGYDAKENNSFYSLGYVACYNINLVPEKIQGVAVTNYYTSLKEVAFGFTQPEYHDGYVYELYTYKNKKVSSGNITSTSYNLLKNIKNQFYKLRVRAYVTINNKNYYGAWSDYTVFALQPKVGLKKSGKKLKITWKKVSGAKNYTVYMSTSKTGGYKKLTTTKKRAYTAKKFKKKKLNKKKTYYVYVVANRKEGKKTYKSKAVNCYYLY